MMLYTVIVSLLAFTVAMYFYGTEYLFDLSGFKKIEEVEKLLF